MPLVRYEIIGPDNATLVAGETLAISPDGARLAFIGTDRRGRKLLWIRQLSSLTATPLPGTEGATDPLWSPDGRSLAFFGDGKLQRIDTSSGAAPQVICETRTTRGGQWTLDGSVFFGVTTGPLFRVSALGGQPTRVTTLDEGRREFSHRYPQVLPDGRHLLFLVLSGIRETRGVYVGALGSTEKRLLVATGTGAVYANGYLLFERNGVLQAQRLDLARLELRGDPIPLADRIASNGETSRPVVSVADTGVLTYATSALTHANQFTWVDRAGKPLGTVGPPGVFRDPVLSPDRHTLAFARVDPDIGTYDIWTTDTSGDVSSPVTFDPATDVGPYGPPMASV